MENIKYKELYLDKIQRLNYETYKDKQIISYAYQHSDGKFITRTIYSKDIIELNYNDDGNDKNLTIKLRNNSLPIIIKEYQLVEGINVEELYFELQKFMLTKFI